MLNVTLSIISPPTHGREKETELDILGYINAPIVVVSAFYKNYYAMSIHHHVQYDGALLENHDHLYEALDIKVLLKLIFIIIVEHSARHCH